MTLYLAPLIIMMFCYIKIFCILNSHSVMQNIEMKSLNQNNKAKKIVKKSNSFYKMRHKTIKMSALFGKLSSF
jgi:hypothetical protein